MPQISLKPTQKIVANYYKALEESAQMSQGHEGAVAPHFAALLRACAAPLGWTLQEQYPIPRKGQHPIRVDGALLDLFQLRHGVWEAKDRGDDLHREVRAKFKQGYPNDNILFQSPERAILVQNGRETADEDIRDPEKLVEVLKLFFAHQPRESDQWEQAVAEFKDKVPELAQSLLALIEKERKENKRFLAALDEFTELVRQSINPCAGNCRASRSPATSGATSGPGGGWPRSTSITSRSRSTPCGGWKTPTSGSTGGSRRCG